MHTNYSKKNFAVKFIDCIVLVSFLFTAIPVRSYAGISDSNLRKKSLTAEESILRIQEELAKKSNPVIVFHRGGGVSQGLPRNTLKAFEAALANGAKSIEFDILLCGTGEIVVAEDSFLQKKGLDLDNLDFNVLKNIDVGNAKFGKQNIPDLAEVLDLVRGKGVELQIHIKGNNKNIVDGLVKLLIEKNMINNVLVTCFDRNFLKGLRELNKEVKIGWLVLPENWKEGKAVVGTDWTEIFRESKPAKYSAEEIKEIIEEAKDWASGLILHANKIDKQTVEAVKKANLSPGAWGVADNLELAKELMNFGVQRLTLDNAEKWDKGAEENEGPDLVKATYTGYSCKDVLSIIQKDPFIKYVFFDIDDTLVNAESVANLYVRAAQKNGVVITAEAIRKYIGVVKFGDPDEAMAIFSQFGVKNKEIVERIINDYNLIFEEMLNTGYFKDFLYEDVTEVFSELQKRGIKIGIITNRYEQLAVKQMESMGILEYVAQNQAFKRTKGYAVLGGDSAALFQKEGLTASLKGKAASLELSAKIFNINSPKVCLMAGDMDADINAARLNNMPSFLMVREPEQSTFWARENKKEKIKPVGTSKFAEEIIGQIRPNSHILSLGSGPAGFDEMFFAQAGHQVVATDFVESSVTELAERIKSEKIVNLKTKVQDITKRFDFPDESFDAVYSHLSLNFMTDAELTAALKEIFRVLKPGGAIYLVAMSDKDSRYGQGRRIEKDAFLREGKLVHYFSGEYLREKFGKFEFKGEDMVLGQRTFYPQGREQGFVQLIAKKPILTISGQLQKIYEARGANMDDYYVPALVVVDSKGEPVAKVKKGDVVIFPNHRSDRAREALRALTDPDFNKRGNRFATENLGVKFVPFNVYDKEYFETHGIQSAFVSEFTLPPYKSIIEILHQAGVMQGYFTESDKGQHVTHFFAGQRDLDYASLGIEVSVIPSEGVKDEKKDPRMKYAEITDNVINYLNKIKDISKKKVIVVNLPVDIQGHNIKGNKERAIKTILAADEATGRIREAILGQKGVYIETADHGNIEKLATLDENGIPLTDKYGVIPFDEHTDNPVNFIIDGLGRNLKFKEGQGLSNIAATLLEILGISKPEAMAESLLTDYQYQEIEGPIVLVIRDGWGVNKFKNKEAKENDGIELAQPPVFLDLLKNCPHTILKAHGDAVGLPDYQMGDSDNGHRVIGTGYNPATLYKQIIEQIENGTFFQNPVLLQAFESAEKEKRDIHIMGLYSSGGIHSDNRFFLALMEMAKKMNFSGKVNIWPILDGRDVMTRVPTENGIFYLNQIQAKIAELNLPNIQLAGTIGRNFAMDRDGINVDISADKKEKLAGTKTGEEADKLREEAVKTREENKKIWEERFKVAYRLYVYGEGVPVKLDADIGGNKTNIRAEVENIISAAGGKIKVALFDIGGVLLNYPRPVVISNFQKAVQVKSGKDITREEVEKLIFTGENAQRLRLDFPIEDFVDELNISLQKKFNSEVKFELKEFMDILFLGYEPPAGMVELVRNLKEKGMGIFVISNNFISKKGDLKALFKDKLNSYYSKSGEENIFNDDNLIMSNEIGVAKPDSMAFNQTLKKANSVLRTNLKPDNILFFDDQWENVGVAGQLGYYTVGLNEETSGVMNFLGAHNRVFNAIGGDAAFPDYLKSVNDEISKLRGSVFDHKVALVVHASFLKKGGALDALREVLRLKPFVKLGIYGPGADKCADLFNGDKDVIVAATLDEMVATLNNRGGVARSKDIVVLSPSEMLDRGWETLKQVGFREIGLSTVDVAKAMEALVGTPGATEAFKKFYGELESKEIISPVSYKAAKDEIFTELKEGVLDLPQIEPVEKISEAIVKESDSLAKFADKYL